MGVRRPTFVPGNLRCRFVQFPKMQLLHMCVKLLFGYSGRIPAASREAITGEQNKKEEALFAHHRLSFMWNRTSNTCPHMSCPLEQRRRARSPPCWRNKRCSVFAGWAKRF